MLKHLRNTTKLPLDLTVALSCYYALNPLTVMTKVKANNHNMAE